MNETRVKEIVSSMTSFSKERYHKSELLTEMLKLQEEVVKITFNEDHASIAGLKIWDVENHLTELNDQKGHIADAELERFKSGCKELCNLIKAEISGRRGEARVYRTLELVTEPCTIMKNIELGDADLRTEIDALVITSAGLIILEVKNTSKDVFIDDRGDMFRTGEFLKWDCNIAEKMAIKETLLRKALIETGIEIPIIRELVVFTDNWIQVQNKFKAIETSFVSQLSYIIDDFCKENGCSVPGQVMDDIKESVNKASVREEYPLDFDVDRFKRDFAVVMSKLESATSDDSDNTEDELVASDFNNLSDETKTSDDNDNSMSLLGTANKHGKTVVLVAAALVAGLVAGSSAGKRR